MDGFQYFLIKLAVSILAAAFFTVFVLTFWPSRTRLTMATVFYGIGIIGSMGLPAYFHFFRGTSQTFGRLPVLEWLMPVLFLCFGVAALVLLWPSIPQRIAFRWGVALFLFFAPLLIILNLLPAYLQFHRILFVDWSWLVYAILWFRIHECRGKKEFAC